MPHVIVKLASGRSDDQKKALAERLAEVLVLTVGCDDAEVSVAIEDVPPADWIEQVYVPMIQPNLDRLYRKPGYDSFDRTDR